MAAPTPMISRITDGHQGKAESPVVRSRTFQLTFEEARALPDVVMSMYLLLISLFILIIAYVYVFH